MRLLRSTARLLTAAVTLGACRTAAPAEKCLPGRGEEVWAERRYPTTNPVEGTLAGLASLHLTPSAGRQARVTMIGPAGAARPDTIMFGSVNPDGYVYVPKAGRALAPGTYRMRILDIGWVTAVRDVSLVPGERLELDVQTREADRCFGPVVHTSSARSGT